MKICIEVIVQNATLEIVIQCDDIDVDELPFVWKIQWSNCLQSFRRRSFHLFGRASSPVHSYVHCQNDFPVVFTSVKMSSSVRAKPKSQYILLHFQFNRISRVASVTTTKNNDDNTSVDSFV